MTQTPSSRPATSSPAAAASQPTSASKPTPPFYETRGPDREVVYKKTPQGELKLHFYLPEGWMPTDKRPAILFFFGGGWTDGQPRLFYGKAEYFASRGLVAVSAEYRIKSIHGVTPDKCVEDARSAMRFLRKNAADYGVDGQRLIAGGGSAGGHIAACTALCPGPDAKDDPAVSCKPQALVLFSPVLDLSDPAHMTRFADKMAISPMEFLTRDCPPMIAFFGTADTTWLAQGRRFTHKSYEMGNNIELWMADGMPHIFHNRHPWFDVTLEKADEFLAKLGYLSGPPTIHSPDPKAVLMRELPPTTSAPTSGSTSQPTTGPHK